MYKTSLQLQIGDYVNSSSIKKLGENSSWLFRLFFPPNFNNDNKTFQVNRFKENY